MNAVPGLHWSRRFSHPVLQARNTIISMTWHFPANGYPGGAGTARCYFGRKQNDNYRQHCGVTMSLRANFRTVALGDPAKEPASAFWACFFPSGRKTVKPRPIGLGWAAQQFKASQEQ